MTAGYNENGEWVTESGLTVREMKDSRGHYRVNLFKEFNTENHKRYPPVYTMKDVDYKGLISARRIYLESADEYEAAMRILGSWKHWKRLCNVKLFFRGPPEETHLSWDGLEKWREEKALQDKMRVRKLLWESAENGNVTAQKILFDGEKPKAGRPSKDKINREARQLAERDEMIREDLKRIKGLALVK